MAFDSNTNINWVREVSLSEKCLNIEFFLVRIFRILDWIQENTDYKKLRIFTQCVKCLLISKNLRDNTKFTET